MSDIVERLREAAKPNDWAPDVHCALLSEAADTIERLRSICGKADVGASFAEVTKDLQRRSTEPPDPS